MNRFLPSLFAVLLAAVPAFGGKANFDLDAEPYLYHQRGLKDRFTALKGDLESGKLALDETSELAFLRSLLAKLNVPVSSQMLVFSTTSLQLRLIRQDNPRALYFTDDLHVGYIPGGRIEIVSLDPELGAIFYIFDIPRGGGPVTVERSERCMNCHSDDDTSGVPGIVIKSVVPGPTGGSLDSFRQERTGHDVPFSERFGGWYVTGKSAISDHWGNAFGRYNAGELTRVSLDPTTRFDTSRYLLPTSDILPQLVHEHQAGFVNRVVHAGYAARGILHTNGDKLSPEQSAQFDEQARIVTRYLLFADEVPLPRGGVEGDAAFKTDFLRNRHSGPLGASLKDFDLKTRMFRYRCSYMIYSPIFTALPNELKGRIYRQLSAALNWTKPSAEYAYLPTAEKQAIVAILRQTMPGLPAGW
jgi:hypothetical protein